MDYFNQYKPIRFHLVMQNPEENMADLSCKLHKWETRYFLSSTSLCIYGMVLYSPVLTMTLTVVNPCYVCMSPMTTKFLHARPVVEILNHEFLWLVEFSYCKNRVRYILVFRI